VKPYNQAMSKKIVFIICALLSVSSCEEMGSPASKQEPVAGILVDQGFALLSQQKPESAMQNFDNALKADDKNVRALQGKGLALNNMGRHTEADIQYGKALEIDVTSVPVRNNFAMSKILQGKYKEAADMLTPISKAHPDNATVQENLALANCMLGKRDTARTLYSKSLQPAEVEDNLRFCKQYEALRKQK
jgi:Flp pilus assembly protein TadD